VSTGPAGGEKPTIIVRLHLNVAVGGSAICASRVADRLLFADADLQPLRPFALSRSDEADVLREVRSSAPPARTPVYSGPAWIGGRSADVACWRAGGAYLVSISGLPALLVDEGGCTVMAEPGTTVALTDTLVEAVLGPGLILALALGGTFTLHASCVVSRRHAVLFLGESGSGKSTIARAFTAEPGCELVGDDVLPVEAVATGVHVLPHYPQLKLPAALQYARNEPARVPLQAIIVLAPDAAADRAVAMEPLDRRSGFIELARHTVAARLFDAELLADHAAFCAAAGGAVAVDRLIFPRRLDALPTMVAAIMAHLAALPV
jgi:hypothetical protein